MDLNPSTLLVQIIITALVVPLFTFLNDIFQGKREKLYRFHEHRLQIYADFARDTADVVWATSFDECERLRRKAWTHIELIMLSSSEEVVIAGIQVRAALQRFSDLLSQLEEPESEVSFKPRHPTFGQTSENIRPTPDAIRDGSNDVYRFLLEFHKIARKDIGLPPLTDNLLIIEIRRHHNL